MADSNYHQIDRCCGTCRSVRPTTDGDWRCGPDGPSVRTDCICDNWWRGSERLSPDTDGPRHLRVYADVIADCHDCPAFRYPVHGGKPYCVKTGDKIPVGDDWAGIPDWCPLEKIEVTGGRS